jgi:hypothetical protein
MKLHFASIHTLTLMNHANREVARVTAMRLAA